MNPVGSAPEPPSDTPGGRGIRDVSADAFDALLTNAPFAVALYEGAAFRAVFSNRAHDEMVGGRVRLGVPLLECLPEMAGTPIFETMREVMRTLRPSTERNMMSRLEREGRVQGAWFDVTWQPLPGASGAESFLLVTAVEVTEHVRARQSVEAAHALVRTITDNASLGLVMMDGSQRCTFMNAAAEQIFGLTFEEVRARNEPLHDVIHHMHPDGSPYPMAECPIDRALPTRMREQGEDVFVRPDGTFYPVAFTASPILEEGVPVGTVIEVQDITQRRRDEERLRVSEAALRRSNEELVEERGKLEAALAREKAARRLAELASQENARLLRESREAVALRDGFVAIASHELRTPLTALKLQVDGFALQLERGEQPDRARTMHRLSRANAQVGRLEKLLNDLLDVSRLTAGRIALHREPADLVPLVREVVDGFREEAGRVGTELEVRLPPSCPGTWDPARIDQVVTNLVSNAMKYGAGRPVRIEVSGTEHSASVVVEDHGIGIAPADFKRIFQRFERAVPKENYGGLGLGLWIVRQVVDAHGGKVEVESRPGQGARFTMTLPRVPPEPIVPNAPTAPAGRP